MLGEKREENGLLMDSVSTCDKTEPNLRLGLKLCNPLQRRRAEANHRQQRAAPGSMMHRKGSFASAKSSSVEELRKVGGTWDLSREPEDKVSH